MREYRARNLSPSKLIRMKSRLSKSTLIIIGLVLITSASTAFALRGYNRSRAARGPLSQPSTAPVRPAPSPATQATPLEGEPIVVRPYGFEPSEIVRPAGQFVLAIENRSQLASLSLDLGLASGAMMANVSMPQGRIERDGIFDLLPGQYVLTEADHPEWVCKITITSK